MPHFPYFRNSKGLRVINRGLANSFWSSVSFSLVQSISVPSNFVRAGFGSNVSTWLTPPNIVRKIQDFALAGWCGTRGARGPALSAEPAERS